jgi:arylsulfatase A-like enzyme
MDTATRVPLIVVAPEVNGGRTTMALAEFIDIFPTLCDLAKLPKPDQLEGVSLTPVLDDANATVKKAAFSRYGPGRSIITGRYIYSELGSGENLERMLYDHAHDPDENVNVAADPEYAAVVNDLSQQLNAQWPR